jgi:hypothetical protein
VKLTSKCTASNPSTSFSRCTGYLDAGRRFVVYGVLLYCDDFQPHSSRTSSYGVLHAPNGNTSIKEIMIWRSAVYWSKSAADVKNKVVLQYIVPDCKVLHDWCAGTGSRRKSCHDIHRRSWVHWRLPRFSHALDVLGHNSRAPCHLCCFVRQDRLGHGNLPYYVWKRALRGEILSSHPGQWYETVRRRIADNSRGRL